MIGLGIFWASAVGIPYLMVASMVPAKRTGVYMGILNMMIVVPMLIETVTFGWIFEPPPRQQGQQRDHARRRADGHRRRGDAVGEPAGRGRTSRRSCRWAAGAASRSTTGSWSVRTAPRPACTPWTGPRRWRRPPRRRLVVVTAYRDADPSSAPGPVRGGAPRPLRGRGRSQGAGEVGHRSDQGAGALHRAAARRRRSGAGSSRHRRRQPGEPDRRRQPRAGRQRGAAARIGARATS